MNRDILILVHGGPIAEPADAEYVLARARHCHGFYGASSMERLPVERALRDQVAKFKAIKKTLEHDPEDHAPSKGEQTRRPAIKRSAGGREEEDVRRHSR